MHGSHECVVRKLRLRITCEKSITRAGRTVSCVSWSNESAAGR